VSDYCTYFIIGFWVEVAREKQEQSQHLFLWNCSLTYFALERIIRAFSFPRTHFGCGEKKKSDTKPIDRTRRLWICKLELPFVGKTNTMPGETTLFPSFVQVLYLVRVIALLSRRDSENLLMINHPESVFFLQRWRHRVGGWIGVRALLLTPSSCGHMRTPNVLEIARNFGRSTRTWLVCFRLCCGGNRKYITVIDSCRVRTWSELIWEWNFTTQ